MFSLTKKQKFSLTIYEKGVIINTIPYVFKNLTLDKIKYLEGLEMDQLLRKLFESVRTDEIYEEIFPYIPMLAQKINKTTLLTILSKGVKPTET
ncbi:MAG: hypothetical protein LBH96_02570 [Candidatus Peribacteria bacterium]|jgi:hypothetical protein|nr:hypothetical protein [Candidatus Peribacteria bacterium]